MSHDPMYTEGGIAAFRCFRPDPAEDGYLESLVRSAYRWKPGPQEADAIPVRENPSGFWGFKTLPEAIYQEGRTDEHVFALTEHWGKMVEHETGLRSQYAEIMAFIEPVRPAQLAAFPREALARNYPDVPVIHQRNIPAKITELGMVTLPKSAPFPLMQWLGPDSELVWAPETIGPDGEGADQFEMLPAAASYPEEMHPADQRLRKVVLQDVSGITYVLWQLMDTGSVDLRDVFGLLRREAGTMYRHRLEGEAGEEVR
jgi:hypothetical protein